MTPAVICNLLMQQDHYLVPPTRVSSCFYESLLNNISKDQGGVKKKKQKLDEDDKSV